MLYCTVLFLYSQDLSNRKTLRLHHIRFQRFLYSQDLSNRKTILAIDTTFDLFLYSQDLSNRKTNACGYFD